MCGWSYRSVECDSGVGWPYGRVVAVEEAHEVPVKARPEVRRNVERVIKMLGILMWSFMSGTKVAELSFSGFFWVMVGVRFYWGFLISTGVHHGFLMVSLPCHTTALVVFCFFFAFVTLAGFWAARWRRPKAGMGSLEEWGLAGRSFGTWVTWFLIGGDLYTAYTVIAVPAALYGAGAMGFFAVPYAVIAYPYMMVVLPRLWTVCHRHGYITFADFVRGRYGNRWLTMAIALTGVLALMPYIALQLVGIRVVIGAMGIHGEWPLTTAFLILAAYTYSSGLRAPAVIAIVKDVMLYVMVIGGAGDSCRGSWVGMRGCLRWRIMCCGRIRPAASIYLKPGQFLGTRRWRLGVRWR